MDAHFDLRSDGGVTLDADPAAAWGGWRAGAERWLFVAPHDDDIVFGAGLTLLAALELGAAVDAAVLTNGRMGYCTAEQKDGIAAVRREEARRSFDLLGLAPEAIRWFDYDDTDLPRQQGRRWAAPGEPNALAGAAGLQNTLTWLLRRTRPTRVFLPNRADLHPDHRVAHHELVISVFHAQGAIWPELGAPLAAVPRLYEYGAYSAFVAPPTHRVRVSPELAQRRLAAADAYASQRQAAMIVDGRHRAQDREYLREMVFDLVGPDHFDVYFENGPGVS